MKCLCSFKDFLWFKLEKKTLHKIQILKTKKLTKTCAWATKIRFQIGMDVEV